MKEQHRNKRFINLSNDAMFKTIIANQKDKRYINKLLTDILGYEVEVIEYLQNELPINTKDERRKRVDVVVKSKEEEIIIIEVNTNYEASKIRNSFYLSSAIVRNLKINEEYKDFAKCIMLINLNFNQGNEIPIKREYYYRSYDADIYTNKQKIINVNVDKCKREWYEKNIKGEKENIYITLLNTDKKEIEELSKKDKIIKEIGEKLIKMNENGMFLDELTEEQERWLIQAGIDESKEIARKEGEALGIKQGIKKGIKEGETKGINKIIKKLLKYMEVKEINKITNVSIEEIEKIKRKK